MIKEIKVVNKGMQTIEEKLEVLRLKINEIVYWVNDIEKKLKGGFKNGNKEKI